MRKPVGNCFVLSRSLSNSRKAVLFPPPSRSSRRNDPAKLKRRLLKWSDVTTTNTTMPKSSSSSTVVFLCYICVGWKNLTHCHNNKLHFGDDSSIIEDDCAMILPTVIKFERQLYKAREEKNLLDIQRVNGPQFLFLDLCAAFLTELRVI
uniref:non-specific serine/threonine protein kinase n=1 Tax=Brassica campestris TaxID=3711 RepID=M4EWA1_BRACM